MNALYLIISIISVIFLFLAVLFGIGIIYILYSFKRLESKFDEGLEVNLIAHRQYNDEGVGWDR